MKSIKRFITVYLLYNYYGYEDGELCELYPNGNSRAKQLVPRNETKTMELLADDKKTFTRQKRQKGYTALIFLSGSLVCISFGTMIGWPSPSYPTLLAPNATIPITLDQSAMIAGMLMNGFVIGTPISGYECLGSKYGVVTGAAVILAGWILMIAAANVLELCISRLLVGIGAGFGIGKLKTYLKEICDPNDGVVLQKSLVLFICLGICISFTIGPFVAYRMLSVVAAVIPGLAFVTFLLVPDTPYHLYKQQKVASAVIALQTVLGKEHVDDEINSFKTTVETKSFIQILRKGSSRKAFAILTFLMTVQQFSGGPSLLVYSQITYTEFNMFQPSLCAIVYSFIFLVASTIGVKYTPTYKRKPVLLLSLLVCTLTSAIHVYYSYFKPTHIYYTIVPFVSMSIFGLSHTAGISVVSQLVINDIFPVNSRKTMTYYWNMYTAFLAVIVTKIFQVLFDQFGMFASFGLFTAVSLFGLLVILLFVTETKGKVNRIRGV